jgi:hypothetical protein
LTQKEIEGEMGDSWDSRAFDVSSLSKLTGTISKTIVPFSSLTN